MPSSVSSKTTAKRVLANAAVGAFACLSVLLAVPVALVLGAVVVAIVTITLVVAAAVAAVALPAAFLSELSARRKRVR